MADKIETRAGLPVEFRMDEALIGVSGYAAVFNEWANIGDYWEERIAPGAFDKVLGQDVPFLIEHSGLPLARTGSKTLALNTDSRGLKIAANLDGADPDVMRIVPKMKRGDLSKMSFGFRVARQEWDESGDLPRRTILEIRDLLDVSIVTNPAFGGTEIGLRSLEAARAEGGRAVVAGLTMGMALDLAELGLAGTRQR